MLNFLKVNFYFYNSKCLNKIEKIRKMNLPIVNYSKKAMSNTIKDYSVKKDHMISGFFKDGSARFVISDISDTLKDAQKRFEINEPKKLSQLGIAYNIALIINSFLNGEERVKF
jgi:hypothetical protein